MIPKNPEGFREYLYECEEISEVLIETLIVTNTPPEKGRFAFIMALIKCSQNEEIMDEQIRLTKQLIRSDVYGEAIDKIPETQTH